MVARPSPNSVRCRPGSLIKFLPTVEEMADTSPICSTMVASAMGMMVTREVTSISPFPLPRTENTVSFQWMGSPTHWAF